MLQQNIGVGVLPAPAETLVEAEETIIDDDAPITADNLSMIRGMDLYDPTFERKRIISYSQIVRLKPIDVSAIEEKFDIPGCFNRFSWQYQTQQLIDEEEST